MARIPCAQPRNLSIVIDGKKIKATLCGDPRTHENWINHKQLFSLNLAYEHAEPTYLHAWELIIPGTETDRPWLACRFRHGPFLRRYSSLKIHCKDRPWLLLSPPHHFSSIRASTGLQAAAEETIEHYIWLRRMERQEQERLEELANEAENPPEGEDLDAMAGLG